MILLATAMALTFELPKETPVDPVILTADLGRSGWMNLTDDKASECGEEYFRAELEKSDGSYIRGCWAADYGSPSVKVLLPNGKELSIPKSKFSVAAHGCLTDSECEEVD